MLIQTDKGPVFQRKSFPLGIINEGDSFERPDGSFEDLINFDYDVETGEIQSRNGTIESNLLDGFDIPDGYKILPGGLQPFSFNNPVDRQVILLFIKHTVNEDVRIFVNTHFNPPAANTDPVGSSQDYENYVSSSPANAWTDNWIELTEWISLVDFNKINPTRFTVDGSAGLSVDANFYRGWFVWNKTKWETGSTERIKSESFACISSFANTGSIATMDIQVRKFGVLKILNFTEIGWNSGDECFLMRYPVIVHKAGDVTNPSNPQFLRMSFTPPDNDWLIKTNVSIECFIGQAGNLWFGFLNKDVRRIDISSPYYFVKQNLGKYYGWWLEYAQLPIDNSIAQLTTAVDQYPQTRYAPLYWLENPGINTLHAFAIVGILDFRQKFLITKYYSRVSIGQFRTSPIFYHGYSRRITGLEFYATDADSSIADMNRKCIGTFAEPFTFFDGSADLYYYIPSYNLTKEEYYADTRIASDQFTRPGSLGGSIVYEPEEAIFNKATFGVFSSGRMFVSGDSDFPDVVAYSILQREDIIPTQNQQPIDSTDKDKNTALNLLGVNPVVFKNNSIHIINIENKAEVDWRPVEVKSRVGCNIPRSIVRTFYGLMFANDEGIWLLRDAGEPINLLRGRRLKSYLRLSTLPEIFGEWYGKHSEAWFYMGDNTFWVCKLSPEERKMGWKTYTFPFTPIDITLDDDGNLYFIGDAPANFAYKYLNDDEMTVGEDATGDPIVLSFTENPQTMGERRTPFHVIENMININYEAKDGLVVNGNIQPIDVEVRGDAGEIMQSKVLSWNVGSEFPESLIWGNDKSNRQTSLQYFISVTLLYLKRLKITELNTLIKSVPQNWKSGYSKKF